MKYEDIKLEERILFENKFKVMIPEGFKEMDESLVKIKYPSDMRPKKIFFNDEGSVDFKFNFLNQTTSPELLGELSKGVKDNLKKVYTSIVFYEEDSSNVDGKKLIWFDFSNNAIGGNVYNIMFYVIIKNNILNGSFSCLYNEAVTWRKVFFDSIESIKEI